MMKPLRLVPSRSAARASSACKSGGMRSRRRPLGAVGLAGPASSTTEGDGWALNVFVS